MEAKMSRQPVIESLQELATLAFLGAGPALGAAIALAFLGGLVLGLIAVLTR